MLLFYQCVCLLLFTIACVTFTACGTSVPTQAMSQDHQVAFVSTSSPATPPSSSSVTPFAPMEQKIVPAATEHISSTTVVPVVQTTLILDNVIWTLPQPQHLKPYAASGIQGTLWVKFPSMVTNKTIVQHDMPPIPSGNYKVFYTPVRQRGGSLSDDARPVIELPSMIDDVEVSITGIGPAGSTHFWVRTYALPRSAQNGGLVQVFWINPHQRTAQEIVRVGGTGGGHFLTMATNPHWLFWQQSDIGDVTGNPKVQTALVDLETGQSREVDVGGAIDENSATWNKDSQLHYTQHGKQFIFNPETKRITSAS